MRAGLPIGVRLPLDLGPEGTLPASTAAPTAYNQSLAGGLTFAGAAPTFAMQRPLTGALSFTGSAPLALVARLLTGSITPHGVTTRATSRLIAATLHPTSTLARTAARRFTAALTPAGSLTTIRLYARALTAAALNFIGGANLYPDPNLYPGPDIYPYGGAILFQLNRALVAVQRPVGFLGTHAAQARSFSATLQPQVVFLKTSARIILSAALTTASLVAVRTSHTVAQALFAGLRNAGSLSTGVNPGRLYPGGGGFGVPMPDSHFQRYQPTLRRQKVKV